jgi:hypothetical protein
LFTIHCWFDLVDVFAHASDPIIALHLWINHQWPSVGVIHDNGILYSEIFLWELINEPLLDLDTVTKDLSQTEVFGTLDLEGFHDI